MIISSRKGEVVFDTDEYPKHGTTAESLAALKPAFDKAGTVTAGNASGVNDGAAAVMVMSESKARALGLPILAVIASYATAGVDPSIMGIGPAPASRRALQKAGWTVDTPDLIEGNEAFAAQAIAVKQRAGMGHEQDQREWRCDCTGSSDRRLGLPYSGDIAA